MNIKKIALCLWLLVLFPNIALAKAPEVFDFDISYYRLLSDDRSIAKDAPKMEAIIRYWTDSLYEATNGQGQLGKVRIYQGNKNYEMAHISWSEHKSGKIIKATRNGWYIAPTQSPSTLFKKYRQKILMNDDFFFGKALIPIRSDIRQAAGGYILTHECGHYIYGLYDEYPVTYLLGYETRWGANSEHLGLPVIMEDIRNKYDVGQFDPIISPDQEIEALNFSTRKHYEDMNYPKTMQWIGHGMSAWDYLAKEHGLTPPNLGANEYSKHEITIGEHYGPAQSKLEIIWTGESTKGVILDHSGSMAGDMLPKSVQTIKAYVSSYTEPGDYLGVVAFTDRVSFVRNTASLSTIPELFDAQKEWVFQDLGMLQPTGGTAIYDAVHAMGQDMYNSNPTKLARDGGVITLLTDGADYNSSKAHTLDATIQFCKGKNISVNVLGLSTEVSDDDIKRLASETGGVYGLANTPKELLAERTSRILNQRS